MEAFMKRTTLTALMLLLGAPAIADTLPGYDRFDIQSAHRARPIAGSILYPAAGPTYRTTLGDRPVFQPTFVFMGPAVAPGPHPLVLLSHGSGGNPDILGWLSAGLVAKGAIVVAVNHPGSTGGDSSPRRSVDLVSRAEDLSAALDTVLSDPAFAPFVDQDRISVVGFSLGGSTALGLAGLRFDGAAQARGCAAHPDAADCGFFLRGGVDFAAAPGFSGDGRDARVTQAIAIDPGFGGAVAVDSIAAVSARIHLINLGEGADRLGAVDVGPTGNNLAAALPDATYTVIAPASHFSFLGLCKDTGKAYLAAQDDDPVCTDPEGVVRAEVHDRLIADIAGDLGL
jgi:predicted dienelactone hydrolase